MSASKSSKCRACGEPLVWAVSQKGRMMPVEKEPHPEGTVQLTERNGSWYAKILKADEARTFQGPLYRSHFSSCPKADQFRRRRQPPAQLPLP